jgi:SOS regulatory protein LexA
MARSRLPEQSPGVHHYGLHCCYKLYGGTDSTTGGHGHAQGDTLLTPRQQEILDFIRDTLEKLGAPPTRAEIAHAFGFASHNAAEEHLRALARKGTIMLEPGSARGIRLVEQLGLPLIGSVAAGSPILAVENVQRRYTLDAGLFSPRADFLLRVRGLSMHQCRDSGG